MCIFFEFRSRNTQEEIRRKEPICIQREGMYIEDKKEHLVAGSAAENRSIEEDLSLCLYATLWK